MEQCVMCIKVIQVGLEQLQVMSHQRQSWNCFNALLTNLQGKGHVKVMDVRAYLDQNLSGQWIGRRGPIEFPPRSPDLTPLDFFLWGTVKDEVYKRHTTVSQAEVYAILACVNRIRETDVSRRRITICSDSQAAVKALSAWKITSGLVLEALDDISAKHKVSLMWVPGHAGVKVNDRADQLARMGSGSSFENNWRVDPESTLSEMEQHLWSSPSGSGTISRACRENRTILSLSLDRSNLRMLVGLLTGHNTFRRHLFVMRVVDDPTCTWCGEEEESSAHILCRCETLGYHRQITLGSRILEPIEIKGAGPKNVLAFAKRAGLRN
nr:unnamed protein product [Callosobruchus analis]